MSLVCNEKQQELVSGSTDSQKITEMHTTIASLNKTVATLLTEVARLSTSQVRPIMKTSIPLLPTQPAQVYSRPFTKNLLQKSRRPYEELRKSSNTDTVSKQQNIFVPLSNLLKINEEVTLFVYIGKDLQGQPIRTTVISIFDGTDLKVTKCEMVSSLIGMQTQKPGKILYKFIEELKNSGHIKRAFNVAPWKLCFVNRDGVEVTLDKLRNALE